MTTLFSEANAEREDYCPPIGSVRYSCKIKGKTEYLGLEWRIRHIDGCTTDATYESLAQYLADNGMENVKSIRRLKKRRTDT